MDQSQAAYHVGVDEWHHQKSAYSNRQHRKDLNARTGPGASGDGSKRDLPEGKQKKRQRDMYPDFSSFTAAPDQRRTLLPTLRTIVAQERRRQ